MNQETVVQEDKIINLSQLQECQTHILQMENQQKKKLLLQQNLELFSLIRNSELCSKFLDKPSETGFVILTLGNSTSKTSFYLELFSLIRNFVRV